MNLTTHDLGFAYRKQTVLNAVDLDFRPGVTALIGPNAAGKSTLLRCLAGLLVGSGAVAADGDCLDEIGWRQWAGRVRYLPQSFDGRAAITVFETVLLGRLLQLGLQVQDRDLERVQQLMHDFDLDSLAERFVSQLSGGQVQRVAVAQSFSSDAKILLLDEPLSCMDLRNQLETLKTISTLTKHRQLTTVIAVHDLNLAAQFADQVCLLHDGWVDGYGKPAEILTSETIRRVYQVNARVELDSSNRPSIWIEGLAS